MKVSDAGLDLIKSFEGLRLTAYKPVKSETYYTIGFGHYGPDVLPGMHITYEQALDLLRKDIQKYETHVSLSDTVYHWTQNEFDALVSFAFNVGSITQLTAKNTRTKAQIAAKMLLYVKGSGKTLPGLMKRRIKEHNLFTSAPDMRQIALEVIDGKWGNGAERRKRLTAAGYDYKSVQALVNKILKER